MALSDREPDREDATHEPAPQVDRAAGAQRDVEPDQVDELMRGFRNDAAAAQRAGQGGGAAAAATGTATASASGARLTDFSNSPDLGEQIVGSSHEHQFLLPINLHADWARAEIGLKGAGFTLDSATQVSLSPTSNKDFWTWHSGYSPRITFSPTRPGRYSAVLTVAVEWPDGQIEHKALTITATARNLDQVGKDGEREEDDSPVDRAQARDIADGKKVSDALGKLSMKDSVATPEQSRSFNLAVNEAASRAQHLYLAQDAGVKIIEDEASRYKEKAKEINSSFWNDLAAVALQMAAGGAANALAKAVAPRVVAAMGKAVSRLTSPRSETKSKDEMSPEEHFLDQLEASTKKDVAGELPKLGLFTGDAVRTGIKLIMGEAVDALTGKGEPKGGDARAKRAGAGHSTNGEIDFFAEQHAALRAAFAGYEGLIYDQARQFSPIVDVAPVEAIEAVQALGEGFDAAKPEAEQAQANATAPQWIALVARSELGEDAIDEKKDLAPDVDAEKVADYTTDMAGLRGSHTMEGKGVLDLTLDKQGPGGRVVRARLLGISKSIVARIDTIPMRDLRIPIRLILGTNLDKPTVVTIDEAGRIRASGDYEQLANHHDAADSASSEAQAYRGTEALVDRLLDGTLASLGVTVEHDDGSK
jgi:hypothetical protein